ncbi:MAG TPA: peptidoglycan DD-metalloendopeptidase family protein [Myxococcales bacterium]|nr:peptidoglycan DD-metalloendopeptidase family protein [Myxococcales bacterium]
MLSSGLLALALAAAELPPLPAPPDVVVDTFVLRPDQTLAAVLYADDLPEAEVRGALGALAGTLDFRKIKSGDGVRIERQGPQLTFLEIHDGPAAEWCVRRDGDKLTGFVRDAAIEKRVVDVDATLTSSLYQAFTDAGEDPQLALAIADVFAWDVDFYLDPRKGDHIRAVVERLQVGDHIVGYGDVLAAEYQGGVGDHQVFRYVDSHGEVGYFDEAGHSARRTFLKSPLKFTRISSGFGMRMHPTLHYRKEHQGVDYAAPTGTPVWSVGDGTVVAAGYKGANGNYVGIRHRNGLETFYCHLSHIAHGIYAGVRVVQKELIGLVGMTGRATGPHLHFALKRDGTFINPLTFKVPRAEPLPASELPDFRVAIAPLLERLHRKPVAALDAPGPLTASR